MELKNNRGNFSHLGFLVVTNKLRRLGGRGRFAGGGVAGYYAHEKGWLSTEKKEVEEKDKEEGAEKTQEVPQETKEEKSKREMGCILPF